jgi:hypothetical protein
MFLTCTTELFTRDPKVDLAGLPATKKPGLAQSRSRSSICNTKAKFLVLVCLSVAIVASLTFCHGSANDEIKCEIN